MFPGGYTFLSGSLFIYSNMIVYVAVNATILGSTAWDAYPLNFYSRYGGTMATGHASLINAGS